MGRPTFADDDPRHGTYAGVAQHNVHGTKMCQDCRDANRRYKLEWRRRLTSRRAFTYPIEVSGTPDIDALGLVVARSIRESA